MATARVFRSGNSQAVWLPKEFRTNSKEVEIFRGGDEVVLREKEKGPERAFDILAGPPDEHLARRPQQRPAAGEGATDGLSCLPGAPEFCED